MTQTLGLGLGTTGEEGEMDGKNFGSILAVLSIYTFFGKQNEGRQLLDITRVD